MDPSRFDAVVRSLTDRSSRRSVIGGGLAALLAVAELPGAEARAQGGGHKGRKRKGCAGKSRAKLCAGRECGKGRGRCGQTVVCGKCPPGQPCRRGVCQANCQPLTCAEQGIACGLANDGCGRSITCGDCRFGDCVNGQCVLPACLATGVACTVNESCCTGACGTRGSSAGTCCIPDLQPLGTNGSGACCNGNFAAFNQNGVVFCSAST